MARATRTSASSFRLPTSVRPVHYDVELELDPARSQRYRGRVRIELQLVQPARELELHAVDLKLLGASVHAGGRTLRARIELHAEHESARVHLSEKLPAGEAMLELHFSGTLRHDLRGLY